VQLGHQALTPPGDARADLWIIQQMAQRFGLDWNYEEESKVQDRMALGITAWSVYLKKCARPCTPPSKASPGRAWCAKAPSPTPA
jgi:anaerobic selenocysteine-containing dehydrogenase